MGAGGASGFLNQLNKNPNATGADLFPKEARANRGVFYNKAGTPRSLGQIYEFFDKKFSGDSAPATMAHKPPKNVGSIGDSARGYQHIPFSLKKPIQILEMQSKQASNIQNLSAYNSLFKLQNHLDAFFKQPVAEGFGNTGLYGTGGTKSPSSLLLDVLR